MITRRCLTLFALPLLLAAYLHAGEQKLSLDVITSSPEGFLVNSTLVSGKKKAILIDAQFTKADAEKVVEAIKKSKKKLTTVYISHAHPDHYFGLNVIKEAFPKAKFVALPSTIIEINETWEKKVETWKPSYGDAIPAEPIIPQELEKSSLHLDGEEIKIIGPVQGDDDKNSYIWIPSLKTAITGDIVFDGVYPWTAETTPEERNNWIDTVNRISELKPEVVIPGHQKSDAKHSTDSLAFMKEYLYHFSESAEESQSADELIAKVKEKYPSLELDVILNIGAGAAIPSK